MHIYLHYISEKPACENLQAFLLLFVLLFFLRYFESAEYKLHYAFTKKLTKLLLN